MNEVNYSCALAKQGAWQFTRTLNVHKPDHEVIISLEVN